MNMSKKGTGLGDMVPEGESANLEKLRISYPQSDRNMESRHHYFIGEDRK